MRHTHHFVFNLCTHTLFSPHFSLRMFFFSHWVLWICFYSWIFYSIMDSFYVEATAGACTLFFKCLRMAPHACLFRNHLQCGFVQGPASFVSVIFQSANGSPSPLDPRQASLPSLFPSPRQIKNAKPFTHKKTAIVQVTRPHINQVFQSRSPNLQPLSGLLVGGFFSGSL